MTADVRYILAAASAAAIAGIWPQNTSAQATYHINAAGGTPIHEAIRGQNAPNNAVGGTAPQALHEKTLNLTNNGSIRGVAGGLAADTYNWINRTGMTVGEAGVSGPPTLEYLRDARDRNAEMFITVNARGTGTGNTTQTFNYTDTSLAPLTTMAANWVRYTNLIAPNHKQGDSLSSGDAAIVNSLDWGSYDRLRAVNEAATKKVTYWEIGNEPDIGIVDNNDPSGSSGYALTPDEYADRYIAITQAMRAVDPTIKVGPVVKRGIDDAGVDYDPWLMEVLSRRNAQVDFISYHPYTGLFTEYIYGGAVPTMPVLEERLRYIRPKQESEYQLVRGAIQENNDNSFFGILGPIRSLNTPVVASEWNPGSWPAGGMYVGRTMAQALAATETVFTFAQNQNMIASQYWVWPVSYFEGAEIPVYKAFEGMRDHMGDTLVDQLANDNLRLYTTKNSDTGEIAIWGLNFSDEITQTLQLSLDNLAGEDYQITLKKLANISGGDTSLMSFTSASASAVQSIDWITTDLTGQLNLSNFSLTLDDATITLLIIQPVPEPGSMLMLLAASGATFFHRGRRRCAAVSKRFHESSQRVNFPHSPSSFISQRGDTSMRSNLIIRGVVGAVVAGASSMAVAAPYTDWGQPYSGGNIPPSMVLLHMDETSGTTATNSGDTGAWGTTNALYSNDASNNVASGAGNPASGFGRAYDSNSTRTLSVPSAPSMVGSFVNGYVIEMWFKADSTGGGVLASKYTGSLGYPGGRQFHLSIEANGTLYFNPWRSDAVYQELFGTTVITPGEWHHVAAQYDTAQAGGNRWELYLDGNLEAASAVTSAWGFTTAANPLWIGSYEGTSSFFDGQIDEFRISSGQYDFQPIPEPAALSLVGIAGLLIARRR